MRRTGWAGVGLVMALALCGCGPRGVPLGGTDAGIVGPTIVLVASVTSGIAPLAVSFDGTHSLGVNGSPIASCTLDYGDGQSASSCSGMHTYGGGDFMATLTATDDHGQQGSATQEIRVDATRSDAGADGGVPDGGQPPPGGAGWSFWGEEQGGPQRVYGATSDQGGNIWVAGGPQGLFLLTADAMRFRRFGVEDGLTAVDDGTGARTQPVISVAGGPAGTVFVGYEGLPGCSVAFETHNFDPAFRYLWKSGDADRVSLANDGLHVSHYDISSGPHVVAAEPQGREKICSVLRIAYHAPTGSVWFGGNHGVAWGDAGSNHVIEHTHPAINGFISVRLPDGSTGYSYTLLTDLYYGITPLPNGDLWLGGANRSALFPWASLGRDFWSADVQIQRQQVDVWPDAVPVDAYPYQRVDDLVTDMAAEPDGSVWASSAQNGLAHITSSGIGYLRDRTVEPNGKASALERDPSDGSIWVGFVWGGVTRIRNGAITGYSSQLFGSWMNGRVPDIQSDNSAGHRRIIVSFAGQAGVPAGIAIYTGP